MAIQTRFLQVFAASPLSLCVSLLILALPTPAISHQLANSNGSPVAHQHVFKRNAYGDGFVTGHVAPTRHGHDMIIWSPAPNGAYNTPPAQIQITPPQRKRQAQPRRTPNTAAQVRSLRSGDGR
jgi:hypothetical protein